MRRPGGIVPPGKAGLLMLAFALIPLLLKEAKPLVRAAGKGLRKLSDTVERVADSSQIDAEPSAEDEAAEPKKKKDRKKKGKKSD